MNKRGVELTISTVIILIISIILLGLIIFFVSTAFKNLTNIIKEYPALEIPPDSDNPISFIPSTIERGKQNKMTIGFYNNEAADITESVVPRIDCIDVTAQVHAMGLRIPVGSSKSYAALVSVPETTTPNTYTCTMIISETEKTFFMEVK